jgi:hypothetical protein
VTVALGSTLATVLLSRDVALAEEPDGSFSVSGRSEGATPTAMDNVDRHGVPERREGAA